MPCIPSFLKKPLPWISIVAILLASIGYGFQSIILTTILTFSSLIFNFLNHNPNPETVEESVQERDISIQNVTSELLQEQELEEEHGGRTSEAEHRRCDEGDIFQDNSDEEGAISDEDSLIEIALPSGVYIDHYREQEKEKKLADDLEFLKKQMSLMELLAELNEMNEENLIEIDLSIGSIKCAPRFEIHA